MTENWRRVGAGAMFLAFTAPFGIVAHLASELAGLGWHDDADVMFSARHGYLLALAIASLAGLALRFAAVPRAHRRVAALSLVARLPFGGRGARFIGLSFLAQFAFFAITQLGEGCPLCGGDVLVGVVAAALAALVGAVVLSLLQRRIIALVFALFELLACDALHANLAPSVLRQRAVRALRVCYAAFTFRSRPPPNGNRFRCARSAA